MFVTHLGPFPWRDLVILAIGIAVLAVFRRQLTRRGAAYVWLAMIEAILLSIAWRQHETSDVSGVWLFVAIAAALALSGIRVPMYVFSLKERRGR